MAHEGEIGANEELSRSECLTLASGQPRARLAAAMGKETTIFPVTLAVGDGALVVEFTDATALHAVAQRRVAVEVDQFDPATQQGWSVVAHGIAFDLTDTLDPRSCSLRRLARPWWPGQPCPHAAMVTLSRIGGRRFPGLFPLTGRHQPVPAGVAA